MFLATVRLAHDAVALDRAFEAVPDMELAAERTVAYSTKWTMPYLWVTHDDFDAVDGALTADPSVGRIVETNEFDGEKYYHLEWTEAVQERVNAYIDKAGSIIEAKVSAEDWELRLRFVDHDQFDAFQNHLAERGHSFRLVDFSDLGASIRQLTS